jgi:acyl-coenzyme A synthetase/AMP-(fatty) acid ligase
MASDLLAGGNMLANRIYESARAQPHKAALIHNGAVFEYAAFARAIEAARTFFSRHALPAGGVAIVRVDDLAEAWVLVFGLRMAGLHTISVNSTTPMRDLEFRRMKTVACLVVPEIEGPEPRAVDDGLGDIRTIFVPSMLPAGAKSGEIPVCPRNAPPFGGHILYTSGTTGTLKKVFMKGEVEDRRNASRARAQFYGANTVFNAMNFGLWTAIGFKHPSAVWHVGGAVAIDQRPDRAAHFFEHNVNASMLSPFETLNLLAQHTRPYSFLDQVELTIAGGFISKSDIKKVFDRLSHRIRIVYGATEIGSFLDMRYADGGNMDWLAPAGDVNVEIVDENDGPLGLNHPGALRILLSDLDADGYLDDAETTAKFFRDGYFYTGDMAVKREDGRVRILGRVADVLNVRGTKIAVGPLEHEIQQMLDVANVCLFGGLNARGDEELVVAIEAERISRTSLEEVAKRFWKSGKFGQLRFIVLEEFPRTQAGMRKINRVKLGEMVRGNAFEGQYGGTRPTPDHSP